jgi:hypothetical protein
MSKKFNEIRESAKHMFKEQQTLFKSGFVNFKNKLKAEKDKIKSKFIVHSSGTSEEREGEEIKHNDRHHAGVYEPVHVEEIRERSEKLIEEEKKAAENVEIKENSEHAEDNEEDLLLCPISQELMTDPVMTPYGHCFQRSSIEQWLEKHNTCPITGKNLEKSQLMPCYTVKAIVEEHLKSLHK